LFGYAITFEGSFVARDMRHRGEESGVVLFYNVYYTHKTHFVKELVHTSDI